MTTDAAAGAGALSAGPAGGTTAPTPGGPVRRSRSWRGPLAILGVAPFVCYVGVFLLTPTLVVVLGAFTGNDGRPTLANLRTLRSGTFVHEMLRSVELAGSTALIGAVFGAVLAWAVSTASRDGALRRVVTAASGVLAQCGGVTLAFAFIATVGFTGLVTEFLRDHLGIDLFAHGAWLFDMPGLVLVYTYFQIPLMVLVFLPSVDGLRPQWREAAEGLGAHTWHYWRYVAGPVLFPPFLGAALLLFANAFSSFATAAALVSQGSPIVTLQIRAFLTSEVILGQQNLGKALGLAMIVVVAVVMTLYALLQRRTARWLR